MDISLPIQMLLMNLRFLVPLAVFIFVIKSSWFKGIAGELLVRLLAKIFLPSDTYHSLHNVTLSILGGTTQIDHIIVSRYGIFVVETKNMKGWIYGGGNQAQWTQKIYRRSFKFQNPLRQNYLHLKALEALLGIGQGKLHSVVAFVGDCTLKTEMPPNVRYGRGYISYIKSFKEPVFSDEEVADILENIRTSRKKPTLATHRAHVKALRTRHESKENLSCPACGSRMTLRKVKRGARTGEQFWGCSSFPKCRVTRNFSAS